MVEVAGVHHGEDTGSRIGWRSASAVKLPCYAGLRDNSGVP